MSSALHRTASTAICNALYAGTETMLENEPGYEGWKRMKRAVGEKEILRFWPGADADTINEIVLRLPAVNYLRPSPRDEEWVLNILSETFPVSGQKTTRRAGPKVTASTRKPATKTKTARARKRG